MSDLPSLLNPSPPTARRSTNVHSRVFVPRFVVATGPSPNNAPPRPDPAIPIALEMLGTLRAMAATLVALRARLVELQREHDRITNGWGGYWVRRFLGGSANLSLGETGSGVTHH
jgi:hypothetical protein